MNLSSARPATQRASVRLLAATGALSRAARTLGRSPALLVLTLHRVVPDEELGSCRSPRGMVLRESLFCRFLDFLALHTEVVDPHSITYTTSLYGRPRVLLTFDDGWADNAEIASPHLARTGMRACFFVVSGLIGEAQPFWPERVQHLLDRARNAGDLKILLGSLPALATRAGMAPPPLSISSSDEEVLTWLKQLPVGDLARWIEEAQSRADSAPGSDWKPDPRERMMTSLQIQSLAEAGHAIGSHTVTHALLPSLSAEQRWSELADSKAALEQQLPSHTAIDAISYPNGSVTPDDAEAASRAGYRVGFTTRVGVSRASADQLLLPRVNIWDGKLSSADGSFCEDQLRYALFWRPSHA